MRNVKRAMLLVTGAAGLVLSAACASTTPTAAPTAAPTTATSATGSTGSTGSPAAATSSPATSTKGSGGTTRCHTGDLKVSDKGDEGGGSAGHHSEFLVFENTSGSACTLEGYPGVSFVTGDSGEQVGKAFNRAPADSPSITLKAGASAHATIEIASPQAVAPEDCKVKDVRGYRVYPPDETASIFVSHPQTACSAGDYAIGTVKALATGTTD
ncbi:DUF4232 domain-containing protein [Winogradskya humida]|uniref:DUF4232 domain-containing protein n=1 Tax=Winogradskya humida TaxID=113566 RepID=A0ABQ3ZGW8_9ACTN|nr:DUF4232 domain-containing protein [Actinoplanes humidus]GIE17787.1 hypothetical protein Ahu01nite_008890 [Actinoplanes humidus]